MLKQKRVMNILRISDQRIFILPGTLLFKLSYNSHHFPGNSAFLFSKKAVVPSLKSLVPKHFPKAFIS